MTVSRTGQPSGRWVVPAWTLLGTLGCMAVAIAFNAIAFQHYDLDVQRQALFAAIALPIALATPLFLLLSIKLRNLAADNHALTIMAATDSLTEVLNRRAFTRTVDRFLRRPEENRRGALLIVDADHFKSINDRFGHEHGDEALLLIAETMRNILRAGDTIGRLGGEEFGIFLPNVDIETAEIVAERVRKSVNLAVFAPGGRLNQLSVSVGGAVFEDEIEFDELFRLADRRLYDAKQFGRNRIEIAAAGGNDYLRHRADRATVRQAAE